jgi:hypothetical protein
LLLLPLPGFDHLFPEVLGIEHQAIEQELRPDVAAAASTLISSHPQDRDTAALQASLKLDCGVALPAASRALTPAFGHHQQPTTALWTAVAQQHHAVEEPLGLLDEHVHSFGHVKRDGHDIHGLGVSCSISC